MTTGPFITGSTRGRIIVTVNTNEVGNDSPGLWNHCAVCSSRDSVIEAQAEPGCVIEVTLSSFLKRYPEYIIYEPTNYTYGTAYHAEQVIGAKYIKYDSWFNLFNGFNCVSLVDYCYRNAIGRKRKFGWRNPDDVVLFGHNNWTKVCHIKQYDTWVRPLNWFDGRIK